MDTRALTAEADEEGRIGIMIPVCECYFCGVGARKESGYCLARTPRLNRASVLPSLAAWLYSRAAHAMSPACSHARPAMKVWSASDIMTRASVAMARLVIKIYPYSV